MNSTDKSVLVALATVLASTSSSAWSNTPHPEQVYWGDTHLHTSNSFDVYLFGTPNSPRLPAR